MPLPPRYCGIRLGSASAPVVVEAFLDLVCPFSKKLFVTMTEHVLPANADRVAFVVHPYPQPWHPQSFPMSQALMAAHASHGPGGFRDLMAQIYAKRDLFLDASCDDIPRNKIYERVADLLPEIPSLAGVDRAAFVAAARDEARIVELKFSIKYGRQNSMHVTPTVLVNGLVENSVSSSWTPEQWQALLDPLFAAPSAKI